MKYAFFFAVIFLSMVTAEYSCSADSTAVHFLFTDEARLRLGSIPEADTLNRIKLLTNLAFLKEYKGYREYRKQAAQLDSVLWGSDTVSVTRAYHWALRVMEIRDWGWFAKLVDRPVANACIAFDSLSSVLACDSTDEIIRFLRVNMVIELAPHAPWLLDSAYTDLVWLDMSVNRSDPGAAFFVELLWTKYYYWSAKKLRDVDKQWHLENAQCYLNRAFVYALRPYYQREIVRWKKTIDAEDPVEAHWSEEVIALCAKKK